LLLKGLKVVNFDLLDAFLMIIRGECRRRFSM
jgi:hypothetical protein